MPFTIDHTTITRKEVSRHKSGTTKHECVLITSGADHCLEVAKHHLPTTFTITTTKLIADAMNDIDLIMTGYCSKWAWRQSSTRQSLMNTSFFVSSRIVLRMCWLPAVYCSCMGWRMAYRTTTTMVSIGGPAHPSVEAGGSASASNLRSVFWTYTPVFG